MFVRQASEDKRFHLTTHYRSTQAAKLLAAQRFDNASQYHHWCCRNLRHEHMVPVGVVIDMILRLAPRSEEAIGRVLVQFSRRATITREQDKVLGHARLKTRMPDEFWVPGSALYQDPLARYHAAGLGNALVERREASWF